MEDRIELKVLGITMNSIHSDAYAVLLEQVDGPYRIPIVVGQAEAASIAMRLQNQIPPRPFTHDLFTSVLHAFGIMPDYVMIHSFNDGIFSSYLHLSSATQETELDSRTSDAVAIALRTGAPIYTTREILERTGYMVDENGKAKREQRHVKLEDMPTERLNERLKHYVDNEQYEMAAYVQRILQARENEAQGDKTD